MAFDGQFAQQTFTLPFEAKFAIVDFYNTLSDAITTGSTVIKSVGQRPLGSAYFVEQNMTVRDSNFLHVSHNWVAPDAMKNPDTAIKRMANRYWTVSGDLQENSSSAAILRQQPITLSSTRISLKRRLLSIRWWCSIARTPPMTGTICPPLSKALAHKAILSYIL